MRCGRSFTDRQPTKKEDPMRYFPLLRSKQAEMDALHGVSSELKKHGGVIPIVEPVRKDRKLLDPLVAQTFPFLLICNPVCGNYVGEQELVEKRLIGRYSTLKNNIIPTLYVNQATSRADIEDFEYRYSPQCALIYMATPHSADARNADISGFQHHVYFRGKVESDFVTTLPVISRVQLNDPFNRKRRNADYDIPPEIFTELHRKTANPTDEDFGDYSIQGVFYSDEQQNNPRTVSIHHIHYPEGRSEGTLYISHFLSDRRNTEVDLPGKVLEAVENLCDGMVELEPSNTKACEEYWSIRAKTGTSLTILKKVSIEHHLEVMLQAKEISPKS